MVRRPVRRPKAATSAHTITRESLVNRRVLMLASLLVLPSALVAQRGGGTQTQANKLNDMFDKSDAPKGPSLRVRDLEDQSPLKLLLDKHKDLKLTDAQVAQLKTNEQTLKDKDAPILKSADSLIHALTPGNPSDAERDQSARRRRRCTTCSANCVRTTTRPVRTRWRCSTPISSRKPRRCSTSKSRTPAS